MLKIAENLSLPKEAVAQTLAVLGIRGSGKALALDTPIPTPKGWTSMGDVCVGDWIFDEAGKPCRVTFATGVQIGNPCYRVTFSDGSEIISDAEHLWLTKTGLVRASEFNRGRKRRLRGGAPARQDRAQCVQRQFPHVVTTREIAATIRGFGSRDDLNHSIDTCNAFELPDANLPIDPYLLGVWLGDGSSANAVVTTADEEIVRALEIGGIVREVQRKIVGGATASYYIAARAGMRRSESLFARLRALSVLKNKHVPSVYLRGSIEQRRALLAGLMDSDGTVQRGSNSCVYSTTSDKLARGVEELVVSLGYIARVTTRRARLREKDCGICYQIRFRPDRQIFRLKRKADRLGLLEGQGVRHKRRMIVSAEPVPSVAVRCIQVNSKSHLFLAGRACIPTHNTNTGVVFAEELLKAEQQVVVIDPVDVWFGLKSSKDGKRPGFSIPVVGGEHADVPLDAGAGTVLADFVVDTRSSVILALRQLSMNDQRRFAADFAKRLYDRKGQPAYRTPLMLIVDEADEFVPQRLPRGHEAMFGAFDRLVRRGRSSGIGVTLISQRAQVINKDVLSQMETLIGMRVLHKLDRAALEAWIEAHDTEGRRQEFLDSLASLGRGDAWVWSPSWLQIFKRVHIRERETFDSSGTPKAGEHVAAPKQIAPVDLEKLKAQMAATIEKAKAEDPRELKKQIAALQVNIRSLTKAEGQKAAPDADALKREFERGVNSVRVALAKELRQYEKVCRANLRHAQNTMQAGLEAIEGGLKAFDREFMPAPVMPSLEGIIEQVKAEPVRAPAPPSPVRAQFVPTPRATKSPESNGHKPEAGLRRMMIALAQRNGLNSRQLGVRACISSKSGTFSTYLSKARTHGWIEGSGDRLLITEGGVAALGQFEPLPTGSGLLEFWAGELEGGASRMLRALADAYPKAVTAEELGEAAAISHESGTFSTYLSRLRTLELVTGKKDALRASEELFG